MRTGVSILAVALEVVLILLVVGLTNGIATESGKRVAGVGADIMLQAPNSSVLLALNSSVMPIQIGARLREVQGVQAVSPVLTQVNSQGGLDLIYGIDVPSFNEVSGGFSFHRGRIFSAPNEIVVDNLYAKSKAVDVGDEVSLLNQRLKITGVVESGKGARIYIDLKTAQEMIGAVDRASFFFIKCEDPEQTNDVIRRIGDLLPSYPARPVREFVTLMTSENIPALDVFLNTVVLVAVTIGLMVIFLSMYTTITERTREIGILRSLGASKGFVVRLILQESTLISVLGFVVGLLLSGVAARYVIPALFPTQVILITQEWVVRAAVAAVLSGILGSLYPSLKAAAQDPIESLAYE